MSIRSGLFGFLTTLAMALAVALPAHASDERPARSEEHILARLTGSDTAVRISQEQPSTRIRFTIAPGARPDGVELILSATPRSARSGGRIEASVNGGRTVVLAPRADSFEARFALYSDTLRAGENTLLISFDAEGDDGWEISTTSSRLRVASAPASGFDTLDAVEAAMMADFSAPHRIFIDASQAGEQRTPIAALTAQGLALRLGEAPIIVSDISLAELVIRAVADPAAATPAVLLAAPAELHLSAADSGALIAAARLFAARSMVGQDRRFGAAQALSSTPLSRPAIRVDNSPRDLGTLANLGAPFGADQGSRAAVVIASTDPEERAASLAVIGRAALASGSAWIYAWFGNALDQVPEGHDVLVLGPVSVLPANLLASAPAEVRAAARAAAGRTPGSRRQFGTTAFANDSETRLSGVTGMAALYPDETGRTIALITSPDGADFSRAAKRLARSSLWSAMEGHAVLWDAAVITPFGPAGLDPLSRESVIRFLQANDRWFALGAFSLAVVLLITGGAVNRTSSRRR